MKVVVRVYTDDGKEWGEPFKRQLTDERYVFDTAQDIESHLESAWQEMEEEEGEE